MRSTGQHPMPKAFDPIEREAIRAALATIGLRHFERHGVRAARVEDICRDVGIAKGSFYAFHASKEALFMAIAAEREMQHRRDLFAFIAAAEPGRVVPLRTAPAACAPGWARLTPSPIRR